MNKIKFLSYILLFGLFLTSCGKDGDTTAPKVTISSPSNGASFTVTDLIELRATITDETKLVSINISSSLGLDNTITTLDTDISHDLGANISLDSLTTAGTYEIKVSGTDADGNVGDDTVEVIIK